MHACSLKLGIEQFELYHLYINTMPKGCGYIYLYLAHDDNYFRRIFIIDTHIFARSAISQKIVLLNGYKK